jgi:hypothetical protein
MVSEQEEKMQEAFDAVTGSDVSSGAGGGLSRGWGNGRGKGVWVVVMIVVGRMGIL